MKKLFLFFSLILLSFPVLGVSNVELERSGQKVIYVSGDYLRTECNDNYLCEINVFFSGKKYKINEASIGNVKILPNHLSLLSSGKKPSSDFSVSFEAECDQYAKSPPVYFCMATVHFKNGVIDSVALLKRTYSDEHIGRIELDHAKKP
jgi:hypothetical protein